MTHNVLIHGSRVRSLLLHPQRGKVVAALRSHEGPWLPSEASQLTAEAYDLLIFTAEGGDLHVRIPQA